MFSAKARVGIISQYENTNDLPEYRYMSDSINRRARGMGSSFGQPLCSTSEENAICGQNTILDRWHFMDVLTHEFSHCIHFQGLIKASPGFDKQLQKTFEAARANGLWEGTYAATNYMEYWAEGVGLWFNCNNLALFKIMNTYSGTREELKAYDPKLYELISKYFTPVNIKNGCY